VALGAYEATPLEIGAAYTIFANQGIWVRPTAIATVRSRDGAVLYRDQPDHRAALDPRVAYLMVDMMEEVLRSGAGAAVRERGFKVCATASPLAGHYPSTSVAVPARTGRLQNSYRDGTQRHQRWRGSSVNVKFLERASRTVAPDLTSTGSAAAIVAEDHAQARSGPLARARISGGRAVAAGALVRPAPTACSKCKRVPSATGASGARRRERAAVPIPGAWRREQARRAKRAYRMV
jgi:hypothetical protein